MRKNFFVEQFHFCHNFFFDIFKLIPSPSHFFFFFHSERAKVFCQFHSFNLGGFFFGGGAFINLITPHISFHRERETIHSYHISQFYFSSSHGKKRGRVTFLSLYRSHITYIYLYMYIYIYRYYYPSSYILLSIQAFLIRPLTF